jgi:hypothetical protein
MARAHYVKKARKTIRGTCVKKGQPYYWWKFRRSGKYYSLTPPTRAQLTQSAFYGALYTLEDTTIANAPADDSLPDVRDEIVSELNNLRDECESSRSNMPEHLQDVGSGEILQNRIDGLENAITEFEQLDFDKADDSESDEEHWERCRDELQGICIDVE